MAAILDFESKKQTNTWYDTFRKSKEDITKSAVTYDQIENWKYSIYDDRKDPKNPTGHLHNFIAKVKTSKNIKDLEDLAIKVKKDIKDTEEYLADKIGSRVIKQLNDFKRIEENRNSQLAELEKKRKDNTDKLDEESKKKYDELIEQSKTENEILKDIISDLEKVEDKEQIASPQLQEFTNLIQKRKDLDKQMAESSGVKTYGGTSLLESKRYIEDFLKDQRAHLKNKSTRQIVGESKFNVSKMFYGVGQELGNKASRLFGRKVGKLEPFHEKLIDRYVDEYGKELEEDGSKNEEEVEKELLSFEKNLRNNFSSRVRQKEILTETDTDKIKDVSRKGKNLYKGGTLDNDVNIVGEKGIEVIKGKDVYTPDGDKTNTGKWADTLKSMLGINRKGNDPLLMHTIALRTDVLDIKKLIGSKFKYDTERDEDLDSLREKELKGDSKETVKESKTDNKDILDSLKDLKSSQNNSLVDDLLIGKGLELLIKKLVPYIIPALTTGAMLTMTIGAGLLLYKGIKDQLEIDTKGGEIESGQSEEITKNLSASSKNILDKSVDSDFSMFSVKTDMGSIQQKTNMMNASQLLNEIDFLTQNLKDAPSPVRGKFNKSILNKKAKYDQIIKSLKTNAGDHTDYYESQLEAIQLLSNEDKNAHLNKYIETLQYEADTGLKRKQPKEKPIGFAMGGDWKVSGENGIEFENVSSNGRSGRILSPLNKSVEHRQSLKDVLKESFKELNGTVQNFNPTEFKNITFQLYKDTVAVLEKNLAKNTQAKENGRIAMINNNIMGNRNQEVVVKEKHIPVSSGDFIRIK